MNYIKNVTPCTGHRLLMQMESGSVVMADFSGRLDTVKCADLANETFFKTAVTDGDFVVWGGGRVRLTVNEVMEVVLHG